jgi:hypothetical protein
MKTKVAEACTLEFGMRINKFPLHITYIYMCGWHENRRSLTWPMTIICEIVQITKNIEMEQRGGGKGAGRRSSSIPWASSWNSFAAAVNNVSILCRAVNMAAPPRCRVSGLPAPPSLTKITDTSSSAWCRARAQLPNKRKAISGH